MNAVRACMSAKQSISIRWVTAAGDIPAAIWDECFPAPYEGRDWYVALEQCGIEDQFTFAYAVIERDDRVVGIAPTFLMNVPIDLVAPPLVAKLLIAAGSIIPRLRYQRTLFVGSPCADEGTVGMTGGVSFAEVVGPLHRAVRQRADEARAPMLVWKDFPAELRPEFQSVPELRELFIVKSYPGTRLALPGGGFDGYLRELRSNRRHNLKKKLKRSREVGKLDSSIVSRPSESELEEIFGLFWQTYQHGKTKFETLNIEFFRLIAQAEMSSFVLLRNPESGKLAAFMLCFHIGNRAINKFIGLDYTIGKEWFLYFRLWEAAVEWASTLGVDEFQSGQTGYRAKVDVGHELIALDNFCAHKNPIVHRIFAAVARGISWATLDDDLKNFLAAYPEAESESYARALSSSAGSAPGPERLQAVQ